MILKWRLASWYLGSELELGSVLVILGDWVLFLSMPYNLHSLHRDFTISFVFISTPKSPLSVDTIITFLEK